MSFRLITVFTIADPENAQAPECVRVFDVLLAHSIELRRGCKWKRGRSES